MLERQVVGVALYSKETTAPGALAKKLMHINLVYPAIINPSIL